MFGFFKRKPLISDDDYDFLIVSYEWLLRNFGGHHFYEQSSLVFPNEEYFPLNVKNGIVSANEVFEKVRHWAGLENWPCKLQAQEEDIDPLIAPAMLIQGLPNSPKGTFKYDENDEVTITYNPDLLSSPQDLISTFAHELSHYLTATSTEDPPGGWDNWEFLTDIAATFLGFGIFMANSAFSFKQYSNAETMGWRASVSGYLSEGEHLYALGIFILLKDIPLDKAQQYLKPHLSKTLKQVVKDLQKRDDISKLKLVKYDAIANFTAKPGM